MYAALKRCFDLGLFVFASVLFFPVMLAIGCAILLDDGLPLFFRQERVGRGRRTFSVLKFRTMRDGKVTRVGQLIRKSGLDELPQFLNILAGDMSFVGPRPLTPEDVRRLGWQSARQDFRWNARPGITGLSQIYAGTGARESLARDRLYLRSVRFSWDIRILAITFLMNILGKSTVKSKLLKIPHLR